MEKTLNTSIEGSTIDLPARPSLFNRKTMWVVIFVGFLAWSLWESGIVQNELINTGGFKLGLDLLRAIIYPELSSEFLQQTIKA